MELGCKLRSENAERVRTKHPETPLGKAGSRANVHQLQKGGIEADLADYRKHDEAEDRGD